MDPIDRKRSPNRPGAVGLLFLLAFSVLAGVLVVLPEAAQPAHAISPVQSKACSGSGTSITCAYASSVTAGDTLAVMLWVTNGAAGTVTMTDTLNPGAWALASASYPFAMTGAGVGGYSYVYFVATSAGGADTVSWSQSTSMTASIMNVFELPPAYPVATNTGTGTGTAASVASFTPGAGDVLLGFLGPSGTTTCATPADFTVFTSAAFYGAQCGPSTSGEWGTFDAVNWPASTATTF